MLIVLPAWIPSPVCTAQPAVASARASAGAAVRTRRRRVRRWLIVLVFRVRDAQRVRDPEVRAAPWLIRSKAMPRNTMARPEHRLSPNLFCASPNTTP